MSTELGRARSRQMIIFLLVCVTMAGLLARLYYWQILQSQSGHNLAQLANQEHIQNQTVNAPRGLIYDSIGQLLATNIIRDDVYIEPYQFASDYGSDENAQAEVQKLVSALHSVLPDIAEDQLTKDFNSGLRSVRIAGPIEPVQSQKLRSLRLPYTFLEPRTWRDYPGGNLAAQILGYVQGTQGMYGVERTYNKLLAGKPGTITAETDLDGHPLSVGASAAQPAVKGADLTLTIDGDMQYIVQTALADTVKTMEAQGGTIVVINVHTGAIVAMAGEPTFDPNVYGNSADQRGCLGSVQAYFNPALYCQYEPGSVMKSVTMAAALDQSLITPDTTFNDPGYISFKDADTVTNWEDKAYGAETMTGVLVHSANVGAAYVAHNILGADHYYPYLERFGFGQLTGLDDLEASGQYRTNKSVNWTPTDLTRQAFGQAITATPLQVAMAYQAIANGGVMMHPYLLAQVNDNGHVLTTSPQVLRQVVSARACSLLTGMLVSAADQNQQATVPGYSVAVKTGTATTQGISDDQTEASMAGFLPASHPQFVILVKIDRPQATIYGGTAAAPLWRSIAQQLMWHYNVPPDRPYLS